MQSNTTELIIALKQIVEKCDKVESIERVIELMKMLEGPQVQQQIEEKQTNTFVALVSQQNSSLHQNGM